MTEREGTLLTAELPSISTLDGDWMEECERLQAMRVTFRVHDIQKIEDIKFVAAFAAAYEFSIVYDQRTFLLSPRPY